MGLHRDNGKEHGSYYIIIGYILEWRLRTCVITGEKSSEGSRFMETTIACWGANGNYDNHWGHLREADSRFGAGASLFGKKLKASDGKRSPKSQTLTNNGLCRG